MEEKKYSKSLTSTQWSVIQSLIFSAQNAMQYDEDMGEYTDFGSIMLSLDKEEYDALMSINL